MNFITKPGKKNNNPEDKILFSKCPICGHEEALLLRDLLKWARFKGMIEDLHYPLPKFRGRYKILDFLQDGFKKTNGHYILKINEVCKIHKIPERE